MLLSSLEIETRTSYPSSILMVQASTHVLPSPQDRLGLRPWATPNQDWSSFCSFETAYVLCTNVNFSLKVLCFHFEWLWCFKIPLVVFLLWTWPVLAVWPVEQAAAFVLAVSLWCLLSPVSLTNIWGKPCIFSSLGFSVSDIYSQYTFAKTFTNCFQLKCIWVVRQIPTLEWAREV